jgi:hypothetical protein
MITAALVVVGVALISGSVMAGLSPVALVCGALLLWSGVVKAIVLRIWRTTLNPASAPDDVERDGDSATATGLRT